MSIMKPLIPLRSVGTGLTILFMVALFPARAQEEEQELPIVLAAAVPMYPATARMAGIQGDVRIQIKTDGRTVSSMATEIGHPILVQAAQDNIRTWMFKEHKPTKFRTTFKYEIEKQAVCRMDNGLVVLRLPVEVEIKVKGIQTCDPAK